MFCCPGQILWVMVAVLAHASDNAQACFSTSQLQFCMAPMLRGCSHKVNLDRFSLLLKAADCKHCACAEG